MTDEQRQKANDFMTKLAKLSQEFNVTINSCGCCDGVIASFKGEDGETREFSVGRLFVHQGAAYGNLDMDGVDEELAVNADTLGTEVTS